MTTTKGDKKKLKTVTLKGRVVDSLSAVSRTVQSSSGSLPILSYVLMSAESGLLRITSNNLNSSTECTLPCKVLSPGSFVVPFSAIYDVVRNIQGDKVTFSGVDLGVSITSDNYEAEIKGVSVDDFPAVPPVESGVVISSPSGEVVDILSKVSTATHYSDIRPEISGVRVLMGEEGLRFVGTDSFRLAEWRVPGDGVTVSGGDLPAFTIPCDAVNNIVRVLSSESESAVSICVSDGQVCVYNDLCRITSRLVDGVFPEYEQIIPQSFKSEILVKRTELSSAIKLVSSLSGKGQDITIRAKEGEKMIEVYSSESELGKNTYRVPSSAVGKGFSLVLNWRYLLDGVMMYSGESISLSVNDSNSPMGVYDPKLPHLRYIIMPING